MAVDLNETEQSSVATVKAKEKPKLVTAREPLAASASVHAKKKHDKSRRKAVGRRRFKQDEVKGEVSALPDGEGSSESSSELSEEILVYETPENRSYEYKVMIGLLSRVGFREQYWYSKIAAYSVILSYLVTYDTNALFFEFCHRFGIAFTVNYVVCMLLVGFPMCYLEMALGQYTSTGIYLVFDRMAPAFAGVAVSSLLVNFLNTVFNFDILVDNIAVISHAAHIISNQKPWDHCLFGSPDRPCIAWPKNCTYIPYSNDIPRYPHHLALETISEFNLTLLYDTCVRRTLLDNTTSISDTDYATTILDVNNTTTNHADDHSDIYSFMSTPLMNFLYRDVDDFRSWKKQHYPTFGHFLCSSIMLFLLLYIMTRNKRTLVKILSVGFFTALFVLMFLLHYTLAFFKPQLPYALPLTIPIPEALFDRTAWSCAVDLTVRSLKLGQGAWTFFGSLFGFHNNILLDCLLLTAATVVITFFYSLIHIIIIDTYLAERSGRLFTISDSVLESFFVNPFSVVICLIDSLHIFDEYQAVMIFWYCLALSISIICNKVVSTEAIVSAMVEMNVTLAEPSSRIALVIIVLLIGMILHMTSLSESGHYRSLSIRRCVLATVALVLVLLELAVIGILYGFRLVFSNTSLMVFNVASQESKKWKLFINWLILILWSVVIPVVVVFSMMGLIRAYTKHSLSTLDGYGYLLIFAILSPVPVMMLHRMYEQYSANYSFVPLFKRNPDLWGPRMQANRKNAEHAERMIRKWW